MKTVGTTLARVVPLRRGSSLALPASTYWVSAALAGVASAAAAGTVLIPGVLRGPAVMNGSARGTALVVLLVAVPVLLLAMRSAANGSVRAIIVWLGAIAYLAYNAVLFVFSTPFNQLFLFYEATLGLSFWSLVVVLYHVDAQALRMRFSAKLPARGLATYALVIVALNGLVWLRNVLPGIVSSVPPSWLVGTGLTTNPVYVQDLAFWLPLMAVAAVWLWLGRPWGYLIVGSMLVMWVIEGVGVAVDQWLGHAADPASTVASATAVPLFATLAVVGLIPLFFYFRNLDRTADSSPTRRQP